MVIGAAVDPNHDRIFALRIGQILLRRVEVQIQAIFRSFGQIRLIIIELADPEIIGLRVLHGCVGPGVTAADIIPRNYILRSLPAQFPNRGRRIGNALEHGNTGYIRRNTGDQSAFYFNSRADLLLVCRQRSAGHQTNQHSKGQQEHQNPF